MSEIPRLLDPPLVLEHGVSFQKSLSAAVITYGAVATGLPEVAGPPVFICKDAGFLGGVCKESLLSVYCAQVSDVQAEPRDATARDNRTVCEGMSAARKAANVLVTRRIVVYL